MNFGFKFKDELIVYRSDYVYKCKNDGNTDGDFKFYKGQQAAIQIINTILICNSSSIKYKG